MEEGNVESARELAVLGIEMLIETSVENMVENGIDVIGQNVMLFLPDIELKKGTKPQNSI